MEVNTVHSHHHCAFESSDHINKTRKKECSCENFPHNFSASPLPFLFTIVQPYTVIGLPAVIVVVLASVGLPALGYVVVVVAAGEVVDDTVPAT